MFDKSIFSNLNILYVEDDESTQEITLRILKTYSQNIHLANNGLEAIELFKDNKIDMIITDLEMPNQNGIDLINQIRKVNLTVPIIVLSGYTDTDHLLPCANLGIQGYLQKPVSLVKIETIFYKIVSYLNLKESEVVMLADNIKYDRANLKIVKDGKEEVLNKKEKMFLDVLIQKKNTLVSYEAIEFLLWESEGESMSSMALRTLVKTLRLKTTKELIRNVSKMGYMIKITD